MLHELAIVGTYDQLASQLRERCGGVFDAVLLDLPSELRNDRDRMQEIIRTVRAS